MAEHLGVSVFPASAGNKLDMQWGIGREVLLADVATEAGGQTEETAFGTAKW